MKEAQEDGLSYDAPIFISVEVSVSEEYPNGIKTYTAKNENVEVEIGAIRFTVYESDLYSV